MPVYRVTPRYSEPEATGQKSAQSVFLTGIDADSPEEAGWLARLRLRLAYHPVEIRVLSWVVGTEHTSRGPKKPRHPG